MIGLTGKSVQNILRSSPKARDAYLADFEAAVRDAAQKCQAEMGDLTMTLGRTENGETIIHLRQTVRASYLGSFLTVMGYRRVDPKTNTQTEGVFWLSDSSDTRESDATLLLAPGKLARFDIGFIGPGNSEISKDKLSRFARGLERGGSRHSSVTFIIVDRLPHTGKTERAALNIGAEIIQMGMQYWPRELAQPLSARFNFAHELQMLTDAQMSGYLAEKLAPVAIQDFLIGVTSVEIAAAEDEV